GGVSRAWECSAGSGRCGGALAHGSLHDVLYRVGYVHQALHVDAWRDDVVGIDIAGLHEVLDFGHGDLAGGGHHGIEVARGLAIDEGALDVTHPRMNDREIGDKPALHDVVLAVDLALLLALRHLRPGAGAGKERRDAAAAAAPTLR